MTVAGRLYGQQTVFSLFKSDIALADKYYAEKNFHGALQLYQNAARKNPSYREVQLRIARCYYSLKQHPLALAHYDNYLKERHNMTSDDLFYYAEAQAATSNYKTAIEYYRKCLDNDPENEQVIKKIWRLNNIQYLYEDSAQYAVRPISLNTEYGELCAVRYKKGIVFMSNRKETQLVETVNASIDAPFYRIYFSGIVVDSTASARRNFSEATTFSKEFVTRFNAGPVNFFDGDHKMVFTSTSNETGTNGKRTLQLYFAEEKNGEWSVTGAFPYNSLQHSISDPAISDDGTVLYFSSDMNGGYGKKDLYRSTLENGKWSKPLNLGETINTPRDEVFPYLHQNGILYFSSDGHPGLGGLDIFRAIIKNDGFDEPENAGYPINSSYDDFGIVIDSLDTHGYFSSNRKNGGYDDDIYELDMDLQTYPLTISGVIKYKEQTWGDSTELKIMPHAKISLLDNIHNVVVHKSHSDGDGNFSIVIPYFSKYVILVTGEDDEESKAVLEIPKRRKDLSDHEIVIVKDIFKQKEKQGNETINKNRE